MNGREKYYKRAKELISYDPLTGVLRWNGVRGNKIISSTNYQGYIRVGITVDGKLMRMLGHKIAWFILHNEIPEFIDHTNRDTSDNREVNIRKCTKSQNAMNRKRNISTKSGIRGITESNGRWLVRIQIDGNRVVIGRYDDISLAKSARDKAEIELFGEFRVKV